MSKQAPLKGERFGAWLRRVRKDAGLTQGELAEKARISLPYLSRIERGARHTETNASPMPTVAVVDRIARALGVTLQTARDAAYGPSLPEAAQENELSALLREYAELKETDRRELRPVLDYLLTEIRHRKRGPAEKRRLATFRDVDRVRKPDRRVRNRGAGN